MIPVVTDTNILVSALYSRTGNEAAAVQTMRVAVTQALVSPAILAEYEDVLHRPRLRFPPDAVSELLATFYALAELAPPHAARNTPASPDPGDTKFIACAVAASAQFLVTGNRRHFPEDRYGTAAVVNARQLLDRLPAQP